MQEIPEIHKFILNNINNSVDDFCKENNITDSVKEMALKHFLSISTDKTNTLFTPVGLMSFIAGYDTRFKEEMKRLESNE